MQVFLELVHVLLPDLIDHRHAAVLPSGPLGQEFTFIILAQGSPQELRKVLLSLHWNARQTPLCIGAKKAVARNFQNILTLSKST